MEGKLYAFFHHAYKIAKSSIIGFLSDDCYLKASLLTYYTLLSIVPILAILFGIAEGFGLESHLQTEIMSTFQEQKEALNIIIYFAQSMLHHAQGGIIAGFGILLLFWSVYALFSSIERILNQIWKIKQDRTLARKCSDYLAMMIIIPLFFALSSSVTIFITTNVAKGLEEYPILSAMHPIVSFFFHLLPFLFCWLLFTILYLFMPNTKVQLSTGLIAGLVGGTAFQLWQQIYIKLQMALTSYGAVYGSFAALPLFLLWLNWSWVIVLGGAELAAHIESTVVEEISENKKSRWVPQRELGWILVQYCLKKFSHGEPAPTVHDMAVKTGASLLLVQELLTTLVNEGVLDETSGKTQFLSSFRPTKDIKFYKEQEIMEIVDRSTLVEVKC